MQQDLIRLNTIFSDKLELAANNPILQSLTDPYDVVEFSYANLLLEEVEELRIALKEKNDVEILDGALDVAVVSLNIAYKLFRSKGLSDYESYHRTQLSFAEVIKSNLSKINIKGEVVFATDGKVLKPNSYTPPNLYPYLDVTKMFN